MLGVGIGICIGVGSMFLGYKLGEILFKYLMKKRLKINDNTKNSN